KYSVINMHDYQSADYTSDPTFVNALKGQKVAAVYTGHIHQDYGLMMNKTIKTNPAIDYINVDTTNGVPVPWFRSGSVECQKLLLAEFHPRYFNVGAVDVYNGRPTFITDADSACEEVREVLVPDPDNPGQVKPWDYITNDADPTARTFVLNQPPTA